MKLIKCVGAYMATNELMQKEWDYKTAYALVRLRRKLQGHMDFYAQEETKLVETFGDKDEKGKVISKTPGVFVVSDPEKQEQYRQKKQDLGDLEVEEDWRVYTVPAPQQIKPMLLEALDGFIQFGEEEES